MKRFDDPPRLRGERGSPEERLASSLALQGTPGQAYVEMRGIPLGVAAAAGIRFDPSFAGRPAVLSALYDDRDVLTSVHGRYLHAARGQNKMLTVGPGGGTINTLGGWRADPLILVEGLFDALSLATCGFAAVATIGRWAPWLPHACEGRVVWIAFDAGRPGDADADLYVRRLPGAEVRRLLPPTGCKDWNTALVKRGPVAVTRWLSAALASK